MNPMGPTNYYAIPAVKNKPVRMESILTAVSEYYHIPVKDIKGKSRIRGIAWARHVYCYLCRKYTTYSLKHIGKAIGDRDHTTVIHASDSVKRLIEVDADLRQDLGKAESHFIHSHIVSK